MTKKEKRKTAMLLLLDALLFAAFLFFCFDTERRAENMTPDGVLYSNPTAETLTFGALSSAAGKQDALLVSGETSLRGTAAGTENADEATAVRLVFTDDEYPKLHTLRMVGGAFFSKDGGADTDCAVISTDLAFRLFGTLEDLPGRSFLAGGKRLTVVGIYQADKSLLARLSSDGLEVVYLPYDSAAAPAELTAARVFVRERSGGEDVTETETGTLDAGTNGQLNLYRKTLLAVQKTLLRQRLRMTLFFDGAAADVGLIVILCGAVKQNVQWLAGKKQRYQAVGLWEIVKRCLLPAALAAAIVAIFRLIAFPLYLPFALTAENVLLPETYLNFAVSEVRAYHLYGGDFLSSALILAGAAQFLFGALSFVQAIAGMMRLGETARKINYLREIEIKQNKLMFSKIRD